MPRSTLQNNILAMLERTGESRRQASLAAGLNEKFIDKILSGAVRSPQAGNLTKLAHHWGVSVDDLASDRGLPETNGTMVKVGEPDPELLALVLAKTRENLSDLRVSLPPQDEARLVVLLYRHILRNKPDAKAADIWLRDMIRVIS